MKKYNNPQLAHHLAILDMKAEKIKILSSSKVINELPKEELFLKRPKIGFKRD